MKLDPAAVAAYNTAMTRVSAELSTAADLALHATSVEQLARELGPVGAGFAAQFGAAVHAHGSALALASHLVSEYGRVMDEITTIAETIDTETADAISRAGVER